MTKDLMQYDLLTQDAMRQVVRKALERVEKEGLPGEHHFFITFSTIAPGVFVSDALKARYPQEMTIVLQHRFWGLEVSEDSFTVSLTFNKVPEQLVIPFAAIRGFYDPVVQFGVQFHVEGAETDEEAGAEIAAYAEKSEAAVDTSDEKKEEVTGEVVSLDAFRKK
ncbi:MAG: hypothetical protein EP347_13085 [Alphaproteobacteria bacterium]|nr:MAG: hypothetical protein EP347_13085 [Alphaproteobacteria bacterium]